jgi:HPt (histidine-containing phosphotransfer) domain-containing protein
MPSPPLSGSAQERLLLLHEGFQRRLPERLAAIRSALDAAASGGSLEEPARLFHRLAGTAGTYGLTAITPIAREGEDLCTSGTAPDEQFAALYRIVRRLQDAAGSTQC